MRLSPLDPNLFQMQAGMACALLLLGRYDEASAWAEKRFEANRTTFPPPLSQRQAMRLLAERRKHGQHWIGCARSIRPRAFLI
jgi:hypothetical protein